MVHFGCTRKQTETGCVLSGREDNSVDYRERRMWIVCSVTRSYDPSFLGEWYHHFIEKTHLGAEEEEIVRRFTNAKYTHVHTNNTRWV
jgi:hypothetical protein